MPDRPEKKPVQIRIEKERKKRWQNEADRLPEYRSLTDLIVASVEGELREEPSSGGSVDVDLGGVQDRLDGIEQVMREIDDTVDETYTLVRRDEMADYTDLKTRIQELIPTGDREEILQRMPETSAGETPEDELEDVIGRTGSASHLVRLLQQDGYSPIEIKGAIEQVSDVSGIEATYAKLQDQKDKRVYRVEG
jgi:hypothetical protein